MQNTTNYALPTWEKMDPIKMDDFNDLTHKLDTALKTNADAVATKAEASTVTAIAQTIANGKICRVKYGSYTGNGTYGAENAVTVTCDFYPVIVIVLAADTANGNRGVGIRGCTTLYNPIGRANTINWTENAVSWYYPKADSGNPPAGNQYNNSGAEYLYLVLGYSSENE